MSVRLMIRHARLSTGRLLSFLTAQPAQDRHRHGPARPSRSDLARPGLEVLGERIVPATFYWIGGGANGTSAKAAANWIQGDGTKNVAPATQDSFVFLPGLKINGEVISSSPCTWDMPFSVQEVAVESDYEGQITLAADMTVRSALIFHYGAGLFSDGNNGFSLVVDPVGGNATVDWSSGTTVNARVLFAAGVQAVFGGNSTASFGRTLTNQGGIEWQDGNFSANQFYNDATGVFKIECDNAFNGTGTVPQFQNRGTVMKTAGTGVTDINTAFINEGALTVLSGTVNCAGGASQSNSGSSTNLASNTILIVNGGYLVSGGNFTADDAIFEGTLNMSAGTLYVGTSVDSPSSFQISGDYVQGGSATLALAMDATGVSLVTVDKGPNNNIGNGSVSLDGAVSFKLPNTNSLPGATPPGGWKFLIWQNRVGNFASWASNKPNGWTDAGGVTYKVSNIAVNPVSPDYDVFIASLPVPAISLSSNSQTCSAGQAVTFTALVTPQIFGSPVPTGSVTFYDGATPLGTVALSPYMGSGGQATLTTSSLSVGSHSITAVYSGDSIYSAPTSTPLTQTVNKTYAITMFSSSNSSAQLGQAVTFTAALYPNYPITLTGTVSFYDGDTLLGTVAVTGTGPHYDAVFTTSSLSLGNHTIVAVYNGDENCHGNDTSLSEYIYGGYY